MRWPPLPPSRKILGVVTPLELNLPRRVGLPPVARPMLYARRAPAPPHGGGRDRRIAMWRYYMACHAAGALPCPPAGPEGWPEWAYIGDLAEMLARGTQQHVSIPLAAVFFRCAMPDVETKPKEIVDRTKRGMVRYRESKTLYRVGPYKYMPLPLMPERWRGA